MKKRIKTPMLKRYIVKFFLRIMIFAIVFGVYITHRDWLYHTITKQEPKSISLVHFLWFMYMCIMLIHLFPTDKMSMALRKAKSQEYEEISNFSELKLYHYVQDQNVKAWKVMLIWLLFNSIFGIFYLFHILDYVDLLMLSVFYFLCDYICILLFCPFQTMIMKNKCCVNCRIYDWGHFMMFTPMLFIRNFFSWSLFFTSCVVLINWELTYARYPHRFWSGSNQKLQCKSCQDRTCQIKKNSTLSLYSIHKSD